MASHLQPVFCWILNICKNQLNLSKGLDSKQEPQQGLLKKSISHLISWLMRNIKKTSEVIGNFILSLL
jgi:hypothetical protein